MLVSHERRIVFVHVQKTGGETLAALLRRHVPDIRKLAGKHAPAKRGKAKLEAWDDYFKFAFVRNPWDRLLSWYTMIESARRIPWHEALLDPRKRRHRRQTRRNKRWVFVRERARDFDAFVRHCADPRHMGPRGPFFPDQMHYLADAEGRLLVDHVGRFERYAEDVGEVFRRIGIALDELPHENRSRHRPYQDHYTPETAALVRERYARDVEAFGYEFAPAAPAPEAPAPLA